MEKIDFESQNPDTHNTSKKGGSKKAMNDFRHSLALVFDDNLHTLKWHNIADYVIIGMILLSTIEIFLSTFHLSREWGMVLRVLNITTFVFFTVEVSLRIWVAPLLNPRWKGFRGRIRYCLTFYGFIDFMSTYPFLLEFFLPLPFSALKVLRMFRIIRLFRITRYTKSFTLMTEAIRSKRHELTISLQFLIIITFILSLILYFCEHEAQPEVYDNGFVSVLWAFTQYLGDPAGFMDTPPVTVFGRVIACIIGLLGIAIFAVPAGILGSGFTEAIEKDNKQKKLKESIEKIRNDFQRRQDRTTHYQIVPYWRTIQNIQVNQGLTQTAVIEAISHTTDMRLVNLATTMPYDSISKDVMAVEHFIVNRKYGCFIDRGSTITIAAPSSCSEVGTGHAAYYLAKIGGFNFISRELKGGGENRSWYLPGEDCTTEGYAEFRKDLEHLVNRPGSWMFCLLAACGGEEPTYPTDFHFQTGGKKGDDTIGPFVYDKETFKKLYEAFEMALQQFEMSCDHQKYHNSVNPKIFIRNMSFPATGNSLVIRMNWASFLWNIHRVALMKCFAEVINKVILNRILSEEPDLKIKKNGY